MTKLKTVALLYHVILDGISRIDATKDTVVLMYNINFDVLC